MFLSSNILSESPCDYFLFNGTVRNCPFHYFLLKRGHINSIATHKGCHGTDADIGTRAAVQVWLSCAEKVEVYRLKAELWF